MAIGFDMHGERERREAAQSKNDHAVLQRMFDHQNNMQVHTYGNGTELADYDLERKIEFLKNNHLAVLDELHESLAEVGWKPWASSQHINEDAILAELVDAWHFMMNIMLTIEKTPEDFTAAYFRKAAKNVKRQEEGYDGVSTKCNQCKRALDDDAVTCYEDPLHPGFSICRKHLEEQA